MALISVALARDRYRRFSRNFNALHERKRERERERERESERERNFSLFDKEIPCGAGARVYLRRFPSILRTRGPTQAEHVAEEFIG